MTGIDINQDLAENIGKENMNTETLIDSFTQEDLQAILRFTNESSSGTIDDLKDKVRTKSMKVS